MKILKKIAWWLYQPYKWLIFLPILGVGAGLTGLTAIVLSALISPKIGNMIGGIAWARISAFFTPMWVDVKGLENIDRKRSYVVVANHQSHYDVFVLYGWAWMDMKWVMKKELRQTPVIGFTSHMVGHIVVDRSDSQAAIDSLNDAKKKIVNGTSVMFFAEGTRSKDGEIGRFKKGAFMMALDLNLPILPMTIKGTRAILPSKTMDLFPGKAELIIHPVIETDQYDKSNLNELIDRTRKVIADSFYS